MPGKRPIGETYLDRKAREKRVPKRPNLLTLRDGIGRNKANRDLRALNVLGCLEVPARNVIQQSAVPYAAGDVVHVGPLSVGLVLAADEGRIAQHVGTLFGRKDALPVQAQGVAQDDPGTLLQRNPDEVLADLLREHDVHLVVHQPHRHLGDPRGHSLISMPKKASTSTSATLAMSSSRWRPLSAARTSISSNRNSR